MKSERAMKSGHSNRGSMTTGMPQHFKSKIRRTMLQQTHLLPLPRQKAASVGPLLLERAHSDTWATPPTRAKDPSSYFRVQKSPLRAKPDETKRTDRNADRSRNDYQNPRSLSDHNRQKFLSPGVVDDLRYKDTAALQKTADKQK